MSVYEEQFIKYTNVVNQENEKIMKGKGAGYFGLLNSARNVMVEKCEEPKANAVILFGFSGNGKTTYIEDFIKYNPDYVVASMDEVVNELHKELNRKITPREITKAFGEEVDVLCKAGKNIIFDGNFLNLLTRSALADTLKLYGYQVNVVDITDNVMEVLTNRIMDVAGKRIGVKIDSSNIQQYVNHPKFIEAQKEIGNYYNKEVKTSNINEQVQFDAIGEGVDNVFGRTTPYEEITRIPQACK